MISDAATPCGITARACNAHDRMAGAAPGAARRLGLPGAMICGGTALRSGLCLCALVRWASGPHVTRGGASEDRASSPLKANP